MSETISGYHNTEQVLNPATPVVTITGTIDGFAQLGTNVAGYASVYGSAETAFTVTNAGLVIDNYSGDESQAADGIVIAYSFSNKYSVPFKAGTITNTGTVFANGVGILNQSDGIVLNSGTIIAGVGIQMFADGSNNLAVNSGLITSSRSDGVGIEVADGTIVNGALGTIDAGVGLFLTTGSISNAGLVNGIVLVEGYFATVNNSGSIFGEVYVAHQGNVLNSGTIAVLGTQSSDFPPALFMTSRYNGTGGTLANAATGVIESSAGFGVDMSGFDSSVSNEGVILGQGAGILAGYRTVIDNSGSITAAGSLNAYRYGTYLSSGILLGDGGVVTNLAGGTIIGGGAGVIATSGMHQTTITAIITNSGLIEETATVAAAGGTLPASPVAIDLRSGGKVDNTRIGTLIGNTGIELDAGGIADNAGLIAAVTNGIVVTGSGTISNSGPGIIEAAGIGVELLAVQTNAGVVKFLAGSVANAGTIIAADGVVFDASGTLNNSGKIFSNIGVQLLEAKAVDNSGSIIAGDAGIIAYSSTVIDNTAHKIIATAASSFVLANTIDGALTLATSGIVLLEGGKISNSAGAVIAGTQGYGIDLVRGGTVSNAGQVTGKSVGILAEGSATIGNSGTITGAATEFFMDGVKLGGMAIGLMAGGSISNSGTIKATETGVYANGTAGIGATLSNSGLIAATGLHSLYDNDRSIPVAAVALLSGGMVSNSSTGTITGTDEGVQIGLTLGAGSVINAGLIEATGTTFIGGYFTYTVAYKYPVTTYVYPISKDANGVYLLDGGTVSNLATGTIAGYGAGVQLFSMNDEPFRASTIASTVTNSGKIEGDIFGVALFGGGVVSNAASGTISAKIGVYINGGSYKITNALSNSGLVHGTQEGVLLGLEELSTSTTLTNTGQITGGGIGVLIDAKDKIINSGTIAGSYFGIVADDTGLAASTNSGLIEATSTAVSTLATPGGIYNYAPIGILLGGGMITNTGTISGAAGGIRERYIFETAATIVNSGKIIGGGNLTVNGAATYGSRGILAVENSNITNLAGGIISGDEFGVFFDPSSYKETPTFINAGLIEATGAAVNNGGTITAATAIYVENGITGSHIGSGGRTTNQNTGTISGERGFAGTSNITLINAGTIIGTGGIAVEFTGTNDKLIDDPSAIFSGTVKDDGNTGTLELASGSAAGTITAFDSQFTGFGTVTLDAGASWALAGTIANLLNNGSLAIAAGSSLDVSSAVNAASTGDFLLSGRALLDIASVLGGSAAIDFLTAASGGTLAIDNAASFGTNLGTTMYAGPLLEDFKTGDVIDLKNIAAAGLKLNYNASIGDLQITSGSGGGVTTLQFQNSSLGSGTFSASSDGGLGAFVTLS